MIFRFKYTSQHLSARRLFGMAMGLMMLLGMQSNVFGADAAKGKLLFEQNCKRCHSTKMEKDLTGPALMGASERIPGGDWKYQWIKNSAAVIQSGDAYAVALWNKWNKASMDPMPHLENADIDDIFAHIDAYQIADDGPTQTGIPGIDEDEGISSMWNWVLFLVFVILILLANIAAQIARMRGVEFFAGINLNKINAAGMMLFFGMLLVMTVVCHRIFSEYYLLENSASEHGADIDWLFWVTMVIVMLVFILTNGILFFFAWKYGKDDGRKAKFYPENHKLELIWTVVPAVVLTVLIILGIKVWTGVMGAPDENEELVSIELSGQQWGWIIRYPGADGQFGEIDVRRIGGQNILGVDPDQKVSKDDFISNELYLPKGKRVDLKIRSRDVLHSVYLPHFRVKMDAVPGMSTRFHFVPIKTTDEYRDDLSKVGRWQEVVRLDTIDTDGVVSVDTVHKYEEFDFELACTEICGRGHFSMRKVVKVLEWDEWKKWFAKASQTTLWGDAKPTMEDEPSDEDAPKLSENESNGDGTTILE